MAKSSSSRPFVLRWGILATGSIAATFTRDLILDPYTNRSVFDVRHVLTAVASSTSRSRATQFVQDCNHPSPSQINTYGSYFDLAADPFVDIIYIATPHSHHFQNVILCLESGKHVLCEKPLTVNAAQARRLFETARSRRLFLLEAVWTRFLPLACELRSMVRDRKVIGEVKRVFADLTFSPEGIKWTSDSGDSEEGGLETKHRLVNLDLAGGALLDTGIYSLTWVFQFLYHIEPPEKRQRPSVVSSITKYPPTGADETTSMLLKFPATDSQGVATTSMRVGHYSPAPDLPSIRIQGTLGEIQVHGPPYRPTGYRIILPVVGAGDKTSAISPNPDGQQSRNAPNDSSDSGLGNQETEGLTPFPIPGTGMFYEADECARCIRDGRYESDILDGEETVALMEVMDQVRQQHGLVYPDSIERC